MTSDKARPIMKTSTATRAISHPRADLTARIASREAAAAGLERAAEALKRAQDAAGAAQADLDTFADLDREIAQARAQMVKDNDQSELPDVLVRKRDARRLARERVEEQAGALEVLQHEHMDAENARRRATEAASLEGFRVLLREASDMADELIAAKRRAWSLTHRLLAIDSLVGLALRPERRLGLLTRMHAEHQRVMDALNSVEPMFVANSPSEPQAMARRRWKEIHAALLADANAPIDFE